MLPNFFDSIEFVKHRSVFDVNDRLSCVLASFLIFVRKDLFEVVDHRLLL